MAIKVMIKRHIKEDQTLHVFELLNKFRSQAMEQTGYISGETLVNHYDNRTLLVVSTWESIDDWIRWQESNQRVSIEAELKEMLEEPTRYEIFDLGIHPGK
jgi:heme-degrading monooxygenase HmoA